MCPDCFDVFQEIMAQRISVKEKKKALKRELCPDCYRRALELM